MPRISWHVKVLSIINNVCWQCTRIDRCFSDATSTDLKVFGSEANGCRPFLEMCFPVVHCSLVYFVHVILSFLSTGKRVSVILKVFFRLNGVQRCFTIYGLR